MSDNWQRSSEGVHVAGDARTSLVCEIAKNLF